MYLDGEAAADAVEQPGLARQLCVEVGRARLDHLCEGRVLWDLEELDVLIVPHVHERRLGRFCALLLDGAHLQLGVMGLVVALKEYGRLALLLVELFQGRLEFVYLGLDLVGELEQRGVMGDGKDEDVVGRESSLGEGQVGVVAYRHDQVLLHLGA